MNFLTGLMTFVLVVDCLLLILLILIQLPKKESGLGGAAFATGATDALFGAGSGNVLTKVTKYAAAVFLGLSLTLYVIDARAKQGKSGVEKELEKAAGEVTPASTNATTTPAVIGTPTPKLALTNTPPATNSPAATNAPTSAVTPSAATPSPAPTTAPSPKQ